LRILEVEVDGGEGGEGVLQFDVEWLAVLRKTHHLLSTSRGPCRMPLEVEPATAQVGEASPALPYPLDADRG
jgi:hypothetical protein